MRGWQGRGELRSEGMKVCVRPERGLLSDGGGVQTMGSSGSDVSGSSASIGASGSAGIVGPGQLISSKFRPKKMFGRDAAGQTGC